MIKMKSMRDSISNSFLIRVDECVYYSAKDIIFAAVVSLLVLLIGACNLTAGVPDWGDDFAAYLNEAVAIANGSFEEQTEINYRISSKEQPEAKDGRLVYVWGYPLVQSFVYRLVGFDFNGIIWYKIPLLLSLSFTGGCLVLLYRTRFSLFLASSMAILFCLSVDLIYSVNLLCSDLPFLFVSVGTLLCAERVVILHNSKKARALVSILYSLLLWLTYETRLSGFTVCFAAFMGHLLMFKKKKYSNSSKYWTTFLPYLIAVLLIVLTEHLWFAPATSNIGDIGQASDSTVFERIQYYAFMLSIFFISITGLNAAFFHIGYVLLGLCIIGMFTAGFKRENIHLTILILGTFAVLLALPYVQGYRYLYNISPFLLMYMFYGIISIKKMLSNLWTQVKRRSMKQTLTVNGVKTAEQPDMYFADIFCCALVVVFVCCVSLSYFRLSKDNLSNWGDLPREDVYSDASVRVYQFIQNNTSAEAIIAFERPRALYLNTGRISFQPGKKGHSLYDADYYLRAKFGFNGSRAAPSPNVLEPDIQTEVVFENDAFTLYRLC